ncbi:MAG: NAD-dependent epimerase/dehydratase family protein [Verrucomicrobiaceae bacterium]
MKIFLTGATGFIGSHVVNQATAAGIEVTGLRRSPESSPRVPLLTDPQWLDSAMDSIPPHSFEGHDVLVHLAAHTPNLPYDTLEQCIYWNCEVALKMLNQAYDQGVRKFVLAGSCFEYGNSGQQYDFIPPNAPLEPSGTYPTSKAMSYLAFREWAKGRDAEVSYHRIFHVYGEGEAATRMWPALRKAAMDGEDFDMTEGEQVRDFINVTDLAAQILERCANQGYESGELHCENLGTGRPQTLKDFAVECWNGWGAKGSLLFGKVPYRANEVMRYVPLVRE